MNLVKLENKILIEEIRILIESAKRGIAVTVNSQMTMLYLNIGKRIKEEVLRSTKAEYGAQIVKNLMHHLQFHC